MAKGTVVVRIIHTFVVPWLTLLLGDWIEVSLPENGRVIQSFDDLKSLNRYAVEKLNIDHFGEEVLATIRAFLSESSAHVSL